MIVGEIVFLGEFNLNLTSFQVSRPSHITLLGRDIIQTSTKYSKVNQNIFIFPGCRLVECRSSDLRASHWRQSLHCRGREEHAAGNLKKNPQVRGPDARLSQRRRQGLHPQAPGQGAQEEAGRRPQRR